MFLSLQSRPNPDENIKDFMSHESCRELPSLFDIGMLRFGSKSDILDCLGAHKGSLSEVKQATVDLIDLRPVIHMTPPSRASHFPE